MYNNPTFSASATTPTEFLADLHRQKSLMPFDFDAHTGTKVGLQEPLHSKVEELLKLHPELTTK